MGTLHQHRHDEGTADRNVIGCGSVRVSPVSVGQYLGDELSGGGPGEDLNLPRSVHDDVLERRRALLDEAEDLAAINVRWRVVAVFGQQRDTALGTRQGPGTLHGRGEGDMRAVRAKGCARAWSKRVAKRLAAVRMPPFGPRLYCFITCAHPTSGSQGGVGGVPAAGRASRGAKGRDSVEYGSARLLVVDCVTDVDVRPIGKL